MRGVARALVGVLWAAVIGGAAPCAGAQGGPSYVIRAGRIMPVSPGLPEVIEGGAVVVRDGKVSAVLGADAPLPEGLFVLDLPDGTLVPGFVAAHTGLGGAVDTERSVSGAFAAADSVDVYGDFRELLSHGVTTAHVSPGEFRLVSGRGGVVKLAGDAASREVLAESDIAVNFLESAERPPKLVDAPVPPSADNMIEPGRYQRPGSRMEYRMAFEEALRVALEGGADAEGYDYHLAMLGGAWERGLPLRVRADGGVDMFAAARMLAKHRRGGTVVGGAGVGDVCEAMIGTGVRLTYLVDAAWGGAAWDLGSDPEVGDARECSLAGFEGIAVAPASGAVGEVRLAAALAQREGLSAAQALAAITRNAAEALGVGDRVGSIEPGKDADILVMTGDPLALTSHVQRVFVGGVQVFAQGSSSVVVRGGTVWLGPGEHLTGGAVLIEDGVIRAVGRSVPVPPGARVVDAGDDAFITPGLIDGYGHLGLMGDRSATGTEVRFSKLMGEPDLSSLRVARAGVTTVMTGPYQMSGAGSRVAALKSGGDDRGARVVADTAAVAFDVRGALPESIAGRFQGRLEAGKAYMETWQRYEQELEAWRKARAEGKAVESSGGGVVEDSAGPAAEDPITGTWMMRVSGPMMPPPGFIEGRTALTLKGTEVEGRVIEPEAAEVDHRIVGTFDGKTITGTIEVDTGGMGVPTFTLTLAAPEQLEGSATLGPVSVDLSGRRIDKKAVSFKVARKRRSTGKDGMPLPPPVDESLEPLKLALEKKIPVLVRASSPAEVEKSLDALVGTWQLRVVLLGAEEAGPVVDRLREDSGGVVLPSRVTARRNGREWLEYVPGDVFARAGLDVAFHSDAEDGARGLPTMAMYAVERGMSAEDALDALTGGPARLYGLGDRIGALKPGCEGDLVIWSGHPLDPTTEVERVLIGGSEVR